MGFFGARYWLGPGRFASRKIEGDDSAVLMERALRFIEAAVADSQPFFAVIWFHAPHRPVVSGGAYARAFADLPPYAKH